MIPVFFNILFFLLPLIFYKNTSELFEFNKIVTLYTFTALIVSAWAVESIRIKKFIFKKTILDWPLLGYLVTLLLSTMLSIDPRTSWLGYYSRFNGGVISQICYTLLYWAFVSNMTAKQSLYTILYSLISTAIASAMAVAEHFGIFTTCGIMGLGWKESCWVQDVQSRVFSSMGQPNWLAAILVATIPLTWRKSYWHYLLSILFFVTLLFTKSRSGLFAFGVESLIFWGYVFSQSKLKFVKEFLILFFVSFVLFFIISSPFTNHQSQITVPQGNSLETGGTESGTIRKFVWLGALNVFKHYPILGTGPETFAFSFPMYKPVGHNLTSEWDFIYNKAHNEFLNYLANTGILGFSSYLTLIIFSIIIFIKSKRFDLLSGYIAILITNFFGFSVVPISLLFFLFPALVAVQRDSITSWTEYLVLSKTNKLEFTQIVAIFFVLCTMYYVLSTVYNYWKADILYNKSEINKALQISPNEPLYISKQALIDSDIDISKKALDLAPFNQNIRKVLVNNLIRNSNNDVNSFLLAEAVIKDGIEISPNDPKLYYQLGILNLKNDKLDEGTKNFEKAIQLKSNYKEARFALGLTYIDLINYEKAKENLEYILKNIDPNDELAKKYLKELK